MNARKPLIGLFALSAALAMPMAFAQDPQTGDADDMASQAQPQLTWADLDTDGDGVLSREEAAAHPALGSVFDQADSDGDGKLTADEYRAYTESQAGSQP